MRKIFYIGIVILLLSVTMLSGCLEENAEDKTQDAVNVQQEQYGIAQPIPYFDFSIERDSYIKIYKARNEQVATYTVWRSDMGMIEGDCPSIGYPIPYDTQLTNPLQTVNEWRSSPVIEQPEPNGLYSGSNSIATWVRCVQNVNGRTLVTPVYIESKVTAYPIPMVVDYETGSVQPVQGAMPAVVIN